MLVHHSHPGRGGGLGGFAISATGDVLGCTCLPPSFARANVRERPLRDIWKDDGCFPYSRAAGARRLEGACGRCSAAPRCRAGCLGLAWGSTGSLGATAYCLRILRGLVPSPGGKKEGPPLA